jgi:PadR family transcriptional regulator PadR
VHPSRVEMVVLGLLADGPAHGYELLERARGRSIGLGAPVRKASVYQALARLEAGRLVSGRVEQGRGGPDRRVYRLTRAGRGRLVRDLVGLAGGAAGYGDDGALALGFAHLLRVSEADGIVRAREGAVTGLLEAVGAERGRPTGDGHRSLVVQAMLDRQEVLARAELAWLRTFRASLAKMEGKGAPGPDDERRPYLR